MSATEAGVAYTRILPSMQGFSAEVSKGLKRALKGPLGKAGDQAGRELSSGITAGVDGQSGKLKGAASRVGDIFKAGLAGAGLAGAALLTAGISSGLDAEAAKDKLVAQLGGGEWAQESAEVASRLYGQAFGASMADTADAVKQVLQSGVMAGAEDMSTGALEEMTARALTFSDVLDQDLNMSLQAVDRMLATGLAGSAEEAFDILTQGVQMGVDANGDLVESFQEYSTMFRDIGLSGDQAMGLLSQGLTAGARDADTVADALKEFAIRAQDGSTASAEGFKALGIDAETAMTSVAAGGDSARLALQYTLEELQGMEDPVARNAAAVALFGTKAEDLGDALFSLDLEGAEAAMDGYSGTTDALGSAYDNAQTRIKAFKRQALQRLTEFIGGTAIPMIERLADWLGPKLKVALGFLTDVAGQVQAFWSSLTTGFTEDEGTPVELMALRIRDILLEQVIPAVRDFLGFLQSDVVPVVQGILTQAGDLWAEHGGEVMEILGQLASIVGDTIALIVAVIDRGVKIATFIWQHWGDEILAVISVAWDLISGVVQGGLDIIQGIIQTVTGLISGDWSLAWDGIKLILEGVWEVIASIVQAGIDGLWAILDLGLSVITDGFQAAWDWVSEKTGEAWDALTGLVSEALDGLESMVSDGLDSVVGFFEDMPGRVEDAFSTLADAITAPFRSAFGSIKSLWNRTVGGFSFSVPDWIPGVGGKGFSIPKMHGGGLVPGPPGSEHLRVLQGGEGVFTREQMAALPTAFDTPAPPPPVLELVPAGESYFIDWVEHIVRVRGGGDVQRTFGEAA